MSKRGKNEIKPKMLIAIVSTHPTMSNNRSALPTTSSNPELTKDELLHALELADSSSAGASASATMTVQGAPASTGTLLTAASAVPTWNFTKIESFFSANGQLPTGVNYTQMVQATTVPADLQQAVMKIVSSGSSSATGSSANPTVTSGAISSLRVPSRIMLSLAIALFAVGFSSL